MFVKLRKRKMEGLLLVMCLLVFFIAGCSNQKDMDKSTLSMKKKGSIVQTVVEDFPTEYDVTELEEQNKSEVEAYNASVGRDAVSIEKTQLKDGKITVVMKYENGNDYFELNGNQLYNGTVRQAITQGYSLDVKMSSTEDGKIINGQTLLQEEDDFHLAIVSEAVDVNTYDKILFVSEGVTVSENKKLATISEGAFPAYIVFK